MKVKPGDCIGILGGGQLGRMLAMAAAKQGIRCHIYCPDAESPAFDVAERYTCAAYNDDEMLRKFAQSCQCITYEFENVPVDTVKVLEKWTEVYPDKQALQIAQDRLNEKNLAVELGISTPQYAKIDGGFDLETALERCGLPAIIKTRRMGYDGKGQFKVTTRQDAENAISKAAGQPLIAESLISFEREVSVILARSRSGEYRVFPVTENQHCNGILHRSFVPAIVSDELVSKAVGATIKIANHLNYVGVITCEYFVTKSGNVMFNEMAPRVHNSGHWTEYAAVTSQFEQHIRAICDWPLGESSMLFEVEMINLIGHDVNRVAELVQEPTLKLHLYGKREARAGRKMGHVLRPLAGP